MSAESVYSAGDRTRMAGVPIERFHCEDLEPCPYLPVTGEVLGASSMRKYRNERGAEFYERALKCAQSLWLQGLPAQSLLQINRALGADLSGSEEVLGKWPLPYKAAVWVMRHHDEEQFIGNPRRHYQHLATRMVEPRKELRTWRAWACWLLARQIFPDFPADEVQIAEEGVREPREGEILEILDRLGIVGEVEIWKEAALLCVD